jgi:hypothetical protein
MLDWIWGLKTVAMLDAWSFEHLLSGMALGSRVRKSNLAHFQRHYPEGVIKEATQRRMDYGGVLLLGVLWEVLEHYLEEGLTGEVIGYWFQGVEFWSNRLVADPLLLLMGYWVVRRYPRLILPARAFSLIWLLVHVFVFPHSMYLHYLF